MKTIKIKSTGVVSIVSEDYFKAYEGAGWFIEVLPEAPKKSNKKTTETTKGE